MDNLSIVITAFATSIDALAVGISFARLKVSIIRPAVIIGAITFAVCLAGVYAGNRSGRFLGDKLELAGIIE